MPFRPEPLDIVIILVVAILIFGPGRLPEIGRGLGRAITEFRQGITGKSEESKQVQASTVPSPSASPVSGNYCNQCGTANPSDARFCNNCGAPLAAPPQA
jgi:sec-independent protein translocase protein TatA